MRINFIFKMVYKTENLTLYPCRLFFHGLRILLRNKGVTNKTKLPATKVAFSAFSRTKWRFGIAGNAKNTVKFDFSVKFADCFGIPS